MPSVSNKGARQHFIGKRSPAVEIDTLAPTAVELSSTTLAVTASANAIVGNLSATDAAGSLTYALVAGIGDTDNAAFTILGEYLACG